MKMAHLSIPLTRVLHRRDISRMRHMLVAYAKYFAYATYACCIREIFRVCNICMLHTRNISRMQQIFTKSDFFQKGLGEIFFNNDTLIRAHVDCTRLKRNP